MEKLRLKLDISISYNPIDRRKNLVEPLKKLLGDQGTVIFGIPGFTVKPDGSEIFDNASLDIVLYNYKAIYLVKNFLTEKGLLSKSKFIFRDNNYNLLNII